MKKFLIIAGIFLLVAVSAWPFYQSQQQIRALREHPKIVLLEKPEPIKDDFALQNDHGKAFNLSSLRGTWTVMFFGYTHCPDICPLTMNVMRQAADKVSVDGKKIQFVFVSVDPDRDRGKPLRDFMQFYGGGIIGVTGPAEQLDVLTEQLHVEYEIGRADDGSVDEVAHSANILVIDTKARLRASLLAPHDTDMVVKAITQLVGYYGT